MPGRMGEWHGRSQGGPGRGHHSLQFISSEASSQSTNWLQRLEFPMHVPSRQRNSPAPQAVSRTVPTQHHHTGSSPRGPGQPSQSAWPTEHPKPDSPGTWGPKLSRGWGGAEVEGGVQAAPHSLLQGISSEPSPQSSTPLHHSMLDTQRPLLHWRKVFLQRRESVGGGRGGQATHQ